MQAAVCREFGRPLTIESLLLAPPGPADVLVDIAACAICHSDITYLDGKWGGELPAVYGHEAAGTIAAVGDLVSSFSPGDRVAVTLIRSCGTCRSCGGGRPTQCDTSFALDRNGPITDPDGAPVLQAMRTGAFAEQVVVHASQIVAIPDVLPFAEASLLACGVITGYGAVTRASAATAGNVIVVVGAGGVGVNAIQGARHIGADKVIAIDISADKLARTRPFGATHTVLAGEDAAQQVAEITDGRGADQVIVSVGAQSAIESAFDYLAPAGEVVLVGMPASGVTATFDPVTVAALSQRVVGTKMGDAIIAEDIPRLIDAHAAGELLLTELISQRFPFDRINDAIDAARNPDTIRTVIEF